MNINEYEEFWQKVMDSRNKFYAHIEIDPNEKPVFPDIDQLKKICLEMRDILREVIISEKSEDEKYREELENNLTHYTNKKFLSEIESELLILKKALLS